MKKDFIFEFVPSLLDLGPRWSKMENIKQLANYMDPDSMFMTIVLFYNEHDKREVLLF